MTRRKVKELEVCVIVMAQCCADEPGQNLSPEECEAIAAVFTRAAAGIRKHEHGLITCQHGGYILAEVALDDGRPGEEEKGLPVLETISIKAGPIACAKIR